MKQLMTGLLVSALLLVGGVPWAMADQILLRQSDGTMTPWGGVGEKGSVTCDNCSGGGGGGGAVQTLTIASGVTTNTTTAAVAGVSGTKTFWGEVVCSSGACAQTQAIYGDRDNDGANGVLLCTITLSGTTRTQDACAVSTAAYPYYYVVTTATSGTSATGAVYAFY